MGTSPDDLRRNCVSTAFRCLACASPLRFDGEDPLRCSTCGKSWPVTDGIPRFFEPSGGPESKAADFLRQALLQGWRTAALNRFPEDRDMQISLLDWQRAAWLPLLALDRNSVALDLGSGYGATTHSLARAAGQVFSLEPDPDRIAFTRIRLTQESLANVQLVQANPLDPPFADRMFDLIVVNGLLASIDRRDAQIAFLKRLCRMLKPDGTVLIGTGNRFGYHGHSRGTSGASGYRKMLTGSGFPAAEIYWSDPGYHQPYSLIPLCDDLIADRVDTLLSEPTSPLRYGWRQMAKRLLARHGVLKLVVPAFVILAGKSSLPQNPKFWQALRARLPDLPDLPAPRFLFSSNPFGLKNVIRISANGAREPSCVIKTTAPAPAGSSLDREYRCLQFVNERLRGRKDACFSVPRLLGFSRLGEFSYLAESVAAGLPLSRVAFPATGQKRFEILREVLPMCVSASVQITQALAPADHLDRVDPSWLDPPPEIASDPDALARLRSLLARSPSDSVQHGDFTVENVFLHRPGGVAVIDWEHLFRGGSPLHDLFTLFISLILGDGDPAATDEASRFMEFESTFFGHGRWAPILRDSVLNACRAFALPEREAGPMLVHFLLLRFNQLKFRKSPLAKDHAAFLAAASRNADRFLIRP